MFEKHDSQCYMDLACIFPKNLILVECFNKLVIEYFIDINVYFTSILEVVVV